MTSDSIKTFQNSVLKLIDEMGINQTQLAERVGIQQSNISTYLKGPKKASLPVIEKIAKGLGVTVAFLFANDEEKALWEQGRRNQPSVKPSLISFVAGLDETQAKLAKAAMEAVLERFQAMETPQPKSLKKSS